MKQSFSSRRQLREHLRQSSPQVKTPQIGFSGYFRVDLISAESGIIKKSHEFKNLITDAALNDTGKSLFAKTRYCAVGTGSTTPTVGDTALVSEVSRIERTSVLFSNAEQVGTDWRYRYEMTFEFTEAQANGNLTEVGMFDASVGGGMWSRSLFTDAQGNPTTITKTDQDRLRITYGVIVNIPNTAVDSVVTINGTNYTFSTRAGAPNSYTDVASTFLFGSLGTYNYSAFEVQGLPAMDQLQGGTSSNASGVSVATTANPFERDITMRFDPAVANFVGGVGSFGFPTYHRSSTSGSRFYSVPPYFYSSVNPKIPKGDLERLTVTFRVSWGRA